MNGFPPPAAPSVWKEVKTQDGKKAYYFNTVTQVTTWDKPPELMTDAEVCASYPITQSFY